jgi:hypothetical protein
VPLSTATGTSLRPPEAEGKADFRDELRALVGSSLNRYIVEPLKRWLEPYCHSERSEESLINGSAKPKVAI